MSELRFDLEKARAFARSNKKDNGLDVEHIIDAINSIQKRIEFLKYFYGLFVEIVEESNLLLDRVGVLKDGNGIVLRNKYEATAFAFLSNLHEMIDSYPFIYLGIFQDKIKDAKYLNWKKMEIHQNHIAVMMIFEFKKSILFSKLDNINNCRKHRALPKILNEYTYLNISTSHDSGEQHDNLKDLLRELHNELIPKYFEILNLTFSEN